MRVDLIGSFYWVMGGWAAVSLVVVEVLCRRLRRYHSAAWDRLGKPLVPWFKNMNVGGLSRFLRDREFRDLNDEVLTRLSWTALLLRWLLLGYFVAFFLWALWP